MKKIVINADDFGLTEAVSLVIVSGHKNGNISSTSLMVNMEYVNEAINLAKECPKLGLGIHLNVTVGKPILNPEDISSLVDKNGNFFSSKDYSANKVNINEGDLLKEFEAQISKFIELVGRIPEHINCHHLYDFFGIYPNVTEILIKKYGVPMRLMQNHRNYKYQLAKKIDILMDNNITEDEVCRYFRENLKDTLVELPNHSGFVDKALMKVSSLNIGRTNDLYICKSAKVRDVLKELGYEIVPWAKI